MSARPRSGPAQTTCSRCRRQKRKCDRATPACSLCTRLRLTCTYQTSVPSAIVTLSRSIPPSHPGSSIIPHDIVLTPSHIKPTLIQLLSNYQPEDVASSYHDTIEPWFPIISNDALCSRLPSTWDEATVDFTLLSVTIVLLGTIPERHSSDGDASSNLMSLYLSAKACSALVEGAGINSLEVAQSKLFIALFEVGHGLHPAAYISASTAVRAIEALIIYDEANASLTRPAMTEGRQDELMITWRGVLIVDRYIAIENGRWPPVTRGRVFPQLPMSIPIETPTTVSPHRQPFLRLFEASTLLDKVHTAIHEPIPERSFKVDEVTLILQTLSSLETILHQELPEKQTPYASSLVFCTIGQLLSFENGSKVYPADEDLRRCNAHATASLDILVGVVVSIAEPLTKGEDGVDMKPLPPFSLYLIYKSAAILTGSLRLDHVPANSLQRLKILREALWIVSQRWLSAERYLNLLDGDTTPRILKAMENI